MSLAKIAFSVEKLLNACQIRDDKDRAYAEARAVQFLFGGKSSTHALVVHNGQIHCQIQQKTIQSFSVQQDKTQCAWTNGNRLSALDSQSFSQNGLIVMLGLAALGLAGEYQSNTDSGGASFDFNSNNNNNNNNNNNG